MAEIIANATNKVISFNQKLPPYFQRCIVFPPQVNSWSTIDNAPKDIWIGGVVPDQIKTDSVPKLHMQILIIFILTQAFNFVLKHLSFPKFTSQIIVRTTTLFNFLIHFFIMFFKQNK